MRRAIETLSLFVLIAVTTLRPLVAEAYDSGGGPITQALGALTDPTPLRTLVFDLLILGAAAGALLARAMDPAGRYRPAGLEWGAGLVAVAALVSCVVAGNKRLAIVASVDWMCFPLLTIALVQLLSRPWHRRLLLAAVLASACAEAVQCFDQYFVGFDDTQAHYEQIKETFWANQGVALDSPKVELFERRMLAREATGSMPHSNVAGSYLMLCGLAALGLAIGRWRTSHDALGRLGGTLRAALAALMFGAAVMTRSTGALVAGGVALALWTVVAFCSRWITARRAKAFVLGWCVAVGGLLAVVGYGLQHGTLPGQSLNFRWQYWRASAGLIADHALTGVGRENFGRHYLQYKSIESPEEVANPHNLFVQAAADWGLLGLVGMVVMAVGASRAVTRSPSATLQPGRAAGFSPRRVPWSIAARPCERTSGAFMPASSAQARHPPHTALHPQARAGEGPRVMLAWMAALGAAAVLGRLLLLGSGDVDYLYVNAVMTGLPWLIGFACFATHGELPAPAGAHAQSPLTPRGLKPAACYDSVAHTAIAAGLFAFMLHEMINFAAFVPGTATTFFALLGCCIAARAPKVTREDSDAAPARWLPAVGLAGATVALAIAVALPVARSTHSLDQARRAATQWIPGPINVQPAGAHFLRATEADPLDPTAHALRAEWLLAASSAPPSTDPTRRAEVLDEAAESLYRAIERDPFHVRHRRRLMLIYRMKAALTGRAQDYDAAVQAAQDALRLYPLDPPGLRMLGDCLLDAGEAAQSPQRLRASVDAYQQALQLDDARPWWETIRRFRSKERTEIETKIAHAQSAIKTP